MPKLKTHKGAAKRFSRTASGRIKRASANRRHILTKMSRKSKRHLRSPATVKKCDELSIVRLLQGS